LYNRYSVLHNQIIYTLFFGTNKLSEYVCGRDFT